MATCTPIYGLPYIECTDPPCDQSEIWCSFAAIVEENLDRFDLIVNRTVDTIPFVYIEATESQVISASGTGRVAFDTVRADTDNMVDLSKDSTLVTISRPGTWIISFNAVVPTSGSGALGSAAFSTSTSADGWIDNGVTTPYFPSFSSIIRVVSATGVFGDVVVPALVRIDLSHGTATTVTSANLVIAWMGDE